MNDLTNYLDQTASGNDVTLVVDGDRVLARWPYNFKFIFGADGTRP